MPPAPVRTAPLLVACAWLVAGLAAAPAVAQTAPAPADTAPADSARSGPRPIEDNSFLVEEAYNQEKGVVQHIATWGKLHAGPGWVGTFTQEWPLGGQRHQLSYTAAEVHPDARGAAARIGDLALNYRYQLRDRAGVLVAPRATVVLPTGSARLGAGSGGVGLQANLPVTFELSPRWAAHANAGGTVVPRGHTADGAPDRATNATLAGSVIWLATPTVNLMLEALWTETVTRPVRGGGPRAVDAQRLVSPGVRYAFNFASGAQVVPGLAVPLELSGPAGRVHASAGLFAYLSVEHAFGRTR